MRPYLAAAISLFALGSFAQPVPEYKNPPESIRAVLDAKPLPARFIDPAGKTLAVVEARRYPSIEELSRPFAALAGNRIDVAANGPHRVGHIDRITFRDLTDAAATERAVAIPPEGDFYGIALSPDGKRFTLRRRTSTSTELWLGDVASARMAQVPGIALQNATGGSLDWMGSDALLALIVPRNRAKVADAGAPTGPVVQESFGRRSPERTFQDLLRNPADEARFEHVVTAELVRINLASGATKVIGPAAMYESVVVGGDGKHILVQKLARPFSYAVTHQSFGREVSLIDLDGALIRNLPNVALRVNVPVQGVVQGPRSYISSATADGNVYWLEALDEGDPRKRVSHRDRLMKLAPPYTGEPVEVLRVPQRATGLFPLDDGRLLVQELDRDRVWVKVFLVDPAKPGAELNTLFDLNARDRYNNPGAPVTQVLPNGRSAARVSEGQVFFVGTGATPTGDRPFLDRWNLEDKSKKRLFHSTETHYESVVRLLDARGERFVTSRESNSEPPNLFLHDGTAAPKPLTAFADPTPQVRAIKRELVKFKRKDGVDLSFWLYKPGDLKPGEKRPAFLWAYPLEYTDPALAGQVSGSVNRFEQIAGTSPLFLVLDGFVVLNDATMPVVGDPEKVNDTFIEQITMNAEAAVAKAAELGFVDPARVAVGGHSYGAFMTANLLAHTDIFKAGIARSGAYNRTLTPFGFQAERRNLWEAQSAYLKLSPYLVADKLKEPLLLIHGQADNNSGTFPEQSDRLFAALAGTGGNVRYVQLPAESHGYAARESVGHTLWEMSTWLRKHLGDPRAP
ncbi:alpha/beta hydrolase family protein [Usitatibacter palustris]|uniref:Peptidase S9 prolyl oligopeptidase catalytic domain-containing protein n=1 Tax=Usitatibacter palustris TaxID=2732487 RepID=A0A6M4H7F1_9PROT|nr:prolyl oligopeptidase family serine peptidase [Usitatibacter palustris]QJR14304.1 hypothetical protein DSM104440_01099 [Usitatibacter palustris]